MDENRRQAYLHAMGIDNYFHRQPSHVAQAQEGLNIQVENNLDSSPTKVIPESAAGVTPTLGLNLHDEVSLNSAETIKKSNHEQAGKIDQVARDYNRKDAVEPSEKSASQVSESLNKGGDSDLEELRFSLQFFPVNEQVAVINEIPYLDNGKSNESIQTLLLAILKALEVSLDNLEEPQMFRWPLAANDDASAERLPEALLTLEGFMHKRLESSSYSYLLVFAGQFAELLQSDNTSNSIFGGKSAEIITTQSLHTLLRVPILKKQVWEDLRSLQGRLSNSS